MRRENTLRHFSACRSCASSEKDSREGVNCEDIAATVTDSAPGVREVECYLDAHEALTYVTTLATHAAAQM
mgnify:CR=1 FL=1